MTSARWWEYEDSTQYNSRIAASWATDAREKGFKNLIGQKATRTGAQPEDWGGRSSFLEKNYFDKQTLDSIIAPQKQQPRPGGILKAFDDITSPIFGGELRQPWDLLRPVQRGLEAYDKAVVRPLARAALSPLPGTYEEQPGWLRFGAELLVDPLNYVPYGALMKAGRLTVRGAQGLRMVGNAMEGTGSRKALMRMVEEGGAIIPPGSIESKAFGRNLYDLGLANAEGVSGGFVDLDNYKLLNDQLERAWREGLEKHPTRDLYKTLEANLDIVDNLERDLKNAVETEVYDYRNYLMKANQAQERLINELKRRGELPSFVNPKNKASIRSFARFMAESVGTTLAFGAGSQAAEEVGIPPILGGFAGAALGSKAISSLTRRAGPISQVRPYDFEKPSPIKLTEVFERDYSISHLAEPVDTGLVSHYRPEYTWLGRETSSTGSLLDRPYTISWALGNKIDPVNLRLNRKTPDYLYNKTEHPDYGRPAYEITISRQTADDWSGRNPDNADIAGLIEVGDVLVDLVDSNPNAIFFAHPTGFENARRYRIYKAAGMVDTPAGFGHELMIDRDTLHSRRSALYKVLNSLREKGGERFRSQITSGSTDPLDDPEVRRLVLGEDIEVPTGLQGETPKDVERTALGVPETIPSIGGGAQTPLSPQSLIDYMTKLAGSGNPLFDNIASYDEVLYDGTRRRSLSKSGRAFIKDHVPQLTGLMEKKGIRLKDLDLHHVVDFWSEQVQVAREYGNKQGDLIRAALKRVPTKEIPGIGTIITDQDLIDQARGLDLLNPAGHLDLETVMQFPERFRIKPEYEASFRAIDDLIAQQEEFEKYMELTGLLDETPKGFKHHQQALRRNDINLGPVMIRRPGSKAPTRQGAEFASKLEGVRNGVEYLPFVDAQAARFSNGMKQFVDEWLNRAISDVGLTAAERVSPELSADIKKALQIKQHAENLSSELQRAVDNPQAWRPPNFKNPSPEVQAIIEMGNLASQQVDQATQIDFFKAAQARNRELRSNITPEWQRLRAERKKFVDSFKDRASEIRQQFPVEYRGKYFPAEIGAEALAELDRFKEPDGITSWLDEVNNAARFFMSGLDVSFLGVNGLIAAFTDFPSFWKAAKTAFSGEGYADYITSLQGSGVADSMVKDGIHWAARSDLSELLQAGGQTPRFIRELRGPVAGAYNVSNTWFTRFGNVLRSSMYKSALDDVTNPAARKELGRTINLVTGFTPGDPTSIERAALYAPRFFRAQLGLLSDALTKGNIGREGAARYLGQFLIEGMFLTYAMKEGLDLAGVEQPDWDLWDPTDPNYFRVRVGGRDISLFGTWDTLFRAVAITFADGPDAAAEYMVRSKASPAVSQLLNVISGETLGGSELSWSSPEELIKSFGELGFSVAPIGLQSAYEGGFPTDPLQVAGATVNFMGTKASPVSPSERNLVLRNEVARAKYNKDWDQLEPSQQKILRDENDLELESKTDLAKSFDRRQGISERFQSRQEQIDQSLPVGKDWIDAYHELKREQSGAYGQWAVENPEGAARMRSGKGINAADSIRQEYFKIFDTADTESWTPEELSEELSDFDARLTPAQRTYLERNTGLRDTPRVKEYKAAQKILRPYWRIEDTIWDRFKGRLPDSSEAQSFQQYVNQYIMRLQAQGVPDQLILKRIQDNPVMSQMQKAVDTLRTRYRRAHPDADRELVKWYGYVPIREQR